MLSNKWLLWCRGLLNDGLVTTRCLEGSGLLLRPTQSATTGALGAIEGKIIKDLLQLLATKDNRNVMKQEDNFFLLRRNARWPAPKAATCYVGKWESYASIAWSFSPIALLYR